MNTCKNANYKGRKLLGILSCKITE